MKSAVLLRLQVGLAFFAFILIGASDGAFGVLLPSLRNFYSVDKATIGWFFFASTIGYLIAAFNSGLLVERLGPRRFLMLGTASFLLGVAVLSAKPPLGLALIMFLPLGFGMAVIDAGLNAYIAGLPGNTSLLNYLHAFYGTGAWIGPIIAATILALSWGWNSVYLVWVGLSLLLLFGFGLFFRGRTPPKQKEMAKGNVLAAALKVRAVWIAALFLLFYVGTEVSLGSWSYTFLLEERHGLPLFSGFAVSGYWLGLTLGRLTVARLAQRTSSKRLIQISLAGVVVGVLLVWLVPTNAVSAFGLFLTGFSLGPIFPTTIALMSNLVSARILPSAIGLLASLGSMGAALFPWLAGNLAQHVGLWSLLPFVLTLTIIMLFLWLALQKQPHVPQLNVDVPD